MSKTNMEQSVQAVARIILAAKAAGTRKWTFLALAVLIFLASATLLAAADLLPDASASPVAQAAGSPLVASTPAASSTPVAEDPVKIVIAKINLSASVADPASTDVALLDAALLKGAVRYPTSAKLGEEGNVVLFGHSSYLPVVGNLAYKTFDGIQKLKAGDVITLYSSDRVYTYSVTSVSQESADSGAIPLSVKGQVLTLSTCDSFGEKSDRFVVTADFVSSDIVSS